MCVCHTTTKWKLSDNEDEQTPGQGHTRKEVFCESGILSSADQKVLFPPTRACLNQRIALVPCVGQTTSNKRVATAVRRHDFETGLSRCCLFALLSREGVRGIGTIRVANLIDAQCERRVAERHVLRRHTEHGG